MLITEDWFAASHFLPLLRALVEAGSDVTVVTRVDAKRAAVEATGARVVPFDYLRGPLRPVQELQIARRLARVVRSLAPDAVHAIALKPIALATAIRPLLPRHALGIHLTGVGFAGTAGLGGTSWIYRSVLQLAVRALRRPDAHLFVENPDDVARLRALGPFADERVTILGGAGVDPERFRDTPLPAVAPMRLGFVGRMVWTKGVDLLIGAHRALAAGGRALRVDLCGTPDPSNPRSLDQAVIEQWAAEPGVTWRGQVSDIAGFWHDIDVCVAPSRGGEGLPRALLEAAACGRPIVTTDVPGCRYFVRDGVEGLIVPPDNVPALTAAIARLADDPGLAQRMGTAARQRLLSGFTEAHLRADVQKAYRHMLHQR